MKRSKPLQRKKRLAGKKKLERKKRLRPVNPERKAKLLAEQFGPQADLCRHLPCCATYPELYGEELRALSYQTKYRQSDPHHCHTTGAGGKDRWTVPLKRQIHRRLDSPGHSQKSVEAEFRVDFRTVAVRLHRYVTSREIIPGGIEGRVG